MPDEQIPEEPTPLEPELSVPPPPIERTPPRMLGGWVAAGVMLFFSVSLAIFGYFGKEPGEPSFTTLQETFKQQVGVAQSLPEDLDEQAQKGVREVLNNALEDAGEYEEAARIAVVAAYELGEEPDETALATLLSGEDVESHDLSILYASETVDQGFVETFTAEESSEFAVRLAQAHALEMSGEDSNRESFLDKNILIKTTVLMIGVGLGGLGGVFCLLLFFTARSAGRLKPVGFAGITVWDGDRLIARFAFYMIGFIVIGTVAALLAKAGVFNSTWAGAVGLLATAVFVVVMLSTPIMGKSDSLKKIVGGTARDFWKNAWIGVIGYLCTIPVLIAVLTMVFMLGDLIPQPTHPIGNEMATAGMYDWIAIALTATILAPLLEELTFRGLLFPALVAQLKRPLWAILACGLLFAAIHPQGPIMWPALMATGCAAAYVRYYTGSLVPSFVLHFLNNAAVIVIAIFMT